MSTIRVDNFAPSAGGTAFGTEGIAKIICLLTDAASITRSTNVSSATDNGTGQYTISFTNAMNTSDDCDLVSQSIGTSAGNIIACGNTSTTSVGLFLRDDSGTLDDARNTSTGHGDLA